MLKQPNIYSPEELIYLRRVIDEALLLLPEQVRTAQSEAMIAKQLMSSANTGERRRIELILSGLRDFEILALPVFITGTPKTLEGSQD